VLAEPRDWVTVLSGAMTNSLAARCLDLRSDAIGTLDGVGLHAQLAVACPGGGQKGANPTVLSEIARVAEQVAFVRPVAACGLYALDGLQRCLDLGAQRGIELEAVDGEQEGLATTSCTSRTSPVSMSSSFRLRPGSTPRTSQTESHAACCACSHARSVPDRRWSLSCPNQCATGLFSSRTW